MNAIELSPGTATSEGSDAARRVMAMRRFPRRAVRLAIEYIQANPAQDVRLEDMAGVASLSLFHFARIFKEATGMVPHRYLMRTRIEAVKKLLHESERSPAAIADDTGFSDQSHMTKTFRGFTGTTPKAFRDSWQTGLQ